MSPPATPNTPTRPTTSGRPRDVTAVDPDVPRPNPGEVITLTGIALGATVTLYSSKAGHRIVAARDGVERQITEYPGDSWASASRYLVAYVEGLLRMSGSTTRGSVYCGDCANPVHHGACPRHGDIG